MDTAAVVREAIALADELDQIRFALGDDCADHVKRTLSTGMVTHWEDAVSTAVAEWTETRVRALSDI